MNITNKIRLAIGTPRQFGTTARSFENVATARQATPSTMKAWQIERYGTTAELTLSTAPTPILRNPDDILIEVHAASVNPIDTRMLGIISDAVNSYVVYLYTASINFTTRNIFGGLIISLVSLYRKYPNRRHA